ncbi:MutS-related protein [Ekhidna sp.]|uniref:MutS-related protein n=1 Tax=Ekhidna sp. TaxID=2608089 RepID=UPI003B5BA54D
MTLSKKKIRRELVSSYQKIKESTFDFDRISQYFKNKSHQDISKVVSDRTFQDLDLDEFFMLADRTTSRVGQQVLYNKIRSINFNTDISKQERLIDFYKMNEKERLDSQILLHKLSKPTAFYISNLFQDAHVSRPKWYGIIKPLSIISLLFTVLIPFYPVFALLLLTVVTINAVIHFVNKSNLMVYLKSLPELIKLIYVSEALGKRKECKAYYQPVKGDLESIKKIKYKISFFQEHGGIANDLTAISTALLEIIKMMYLLEPIFFFSALKTLETKRKEIENIFNFVGQIDCCISLAGFRESIDGDWSHPQFKTEHQGITAKEIYHPLIHNPTANSIEVTSKSVLLTGSNMSGKTTFIRTIGINFIASATLNTCFAKEFKLRPLKVFTAVRISDDLLNDKSYYQEEVLTIKEMLEASRNGDGLFLLDEVFKGTNTIERVAAGKAVLNHLSKNDNIVFVSTHDVELSNLLSDYFDSYHFCELINKSNVSFDYLLKKGKLKEGNAIKILEANGYPNVVIDDAKRVVDSLS